MGKNGIVQLFFPVKVKIHNLMISKLLVDYVKGRHKIAESLGGVGYVGAGKKGSIQNGLHAVHLQAAADLLHPAPQQLAAQQKAVKQLETQQQMLLERTAWLS